jgi:hypothetical protein
LLTDRDDASFRAFADDTDGSLFVIHIVRRETRQLRKAQARRIHELEHRFVTMAQQCVGFAFQQPMCFVRRQCSRQAFRCLRRAYAEARVVAIAMIPREIAIEAPPPRKHAR